MEDARSPRRGRHNAVVTTTRSAGWWRTVRDGARRGVSDHVEPCAVRRRTGGRSHSSADRTLAASRSTRPPATSAPPVPQRHTGHASGPTSRSAAPGRRTPPTGCPGAGRGSPPRPDGRPGRPTRRPARSCRSARHRRTDRRADGPPPAAGRPAADGRARRPAGKAARVWTGNRRPRPRRPGRSRLASAAGHAARRPLGAAPAGRQPATAGAQHDTCRVRAAASRPGKVDDGPVDAGQRR